MISNNTTKRMFFGTTGSWLAWMCVVLPTLLLHCYAYGHGLLTTDDSMVYLSASQNFSQHLSLIDHDGHHLLFWTPLYSVFISVFSHPIQSLGYVNIGLLLLISLSVFKISYRIIQSPVVAFFCFFFIIMGVHLLLISTFLWTELLFLFFTLIFIESLMKTEEDNRGIYVAITMGILMCLQRNAGVFIISGASLWIYLRRMSSERISIHPIIFLISSVSASLIWNVYVWVYLPHEQFSFSVGFFQHINSNLNSLACASLSPFLPIKNFGIPVSVVAMVLLIYLMREEIRKNILVRLLVAVTLSYLFFLSIIIVVNIAGYQVNIGEGERFVAVILPFLSILVFKLIDLFLVGRSRLIKRVSYLLIAIWLIYPISRTLKNAIQWHNSERIETAWSEDVYK